MSKEDKLILGTLAGVDLVLSPEHYEEYKGTLNKQLEEKDKEIDRLNNIIETYKNANEYHQNKIEELEKLLRKTPSQLISENVDLRAKNNRLNNIINELEKYLIEHIDEYREMEQDAMFEFGLVLDKLKELKENK